MSAPMARIAERHEAGAPGEWFVDSRCIDCDAARQVAPGLVVRNRSDGNSVFVRQPETADEIEMAWRAVMVCPTRSVGHATLKRPDMPVFPENLGDEVYRLGHNARSSFGAHSYLVRRSGANLMVDAPRWTREVVAPLEGLGGVDHVLLSHRDDIADAERYAEHFGARVWIHADDSDAAPFATDIIEGDDPAVIVDGSGSDSSVAVTSARSACAGSGDESDEMAVGADAGGAGEVVVFAVPGHTKGSVLYLVDGHLLFTGDSLCRHPRRQALHAFRDACWYSWEAQTAALGRFAAGEYRFDRLFAGHGWNHDASADVFQRLLHELVARMPSM